MANTIQIKRSSTASDTPSASDLAVGELAVNTADAKLFTKHTDGTVKELAGGGGGGGSVALDDITTGDSASTLATTAGNITIDAQGSDTDIIFKGTDGSSDITALTLDMSENGQLQIISTIRHAPSGADKYTTLSFGNQGQQDQSIVFPNASGTILLNSGSQSITGDLTLISTDTGATENPTLDLYRNSSSAAVNDVLGHIDFSGMNDASTPEKVVYAKINVDIADETDGTEDGRLDISVIGNGSNSARMTLQGNGHTLFDGRDVRFQSGIDLLFEGATQNGTRTTLTVADPSSARTVTLPDATGTVLTTGNSDTPSTTTSSGDADFVLIDDGGTMKKITPSNLGIGGGGGGSNTIIVQDEGSTLSTNATTLNFVGSGVVASGTGATKTVTITGGSTSPDIKVLLATTTVSSSVSSVDFDNSLITDTYTTYWVKVNNVTVSSSNTALNMRLGTSNAVDTGNNYVWRQSHLGVRVGDSFDQAVSADSTDSRWLMSDDSTAQALGNDATMQWSASWKLYNLRSTTTGKGCVIWDESFGKTRSNFYNTFTLQRNIWHYGVEDTAVNFIRFYLTNGTIDSGVFRLYGSNE